MNKFSLQFLAGVLVGNWLVLPTFFPGMTHGDSFFIGLTAVSLLFLLSLFFQTHPRKRAAK
jgi:hypothetical protein